MLRFKQLMLGVSLDLPELAKLNEEVISSISDGVRYMDELVDYLMGRRRDDARWVGILSAVLVAFLGVFAVFIGNVLTGNCVTRFL